MLRKLPADAEVKPLYGEPSETEWFQKTQEALRARRFITALVVRKRKTILRTRERRLASSHYWLQRRWQVLVREREAAVADEEGIPMPKAKKRRGVAAPPPPPPGPVEEEEKTPLTEAQVCAVCSRPPAPPLRADVCA